MKVPGFRVILLALAIGLFAVIGCEKKVDEAATTEAEKAVEVVEETEAVEIVEEAAEAVEPEEVAEAVEEAVAEKAKETITAVVIDEARPLSVIRAEAADLNDASLRAAAIGYKDQIFAKQDELAGLTGKLPKVPGIEEFGEEPFAPEPDVSDLMKSMSDLTERYQIYFDMLKARGGNLSGLGL